MTPLLRFHFRKLLEKTKKKRNKNFQEGEIEKAFFFMYSTWIEQRTQHIEKG